MALSFVGSKAGSHNATSAQSVSLTDLLDSAGAAASLAQDDIVIVTVVHSMATTASRTLAQLTPSGYSNPTGHAASIQANDSNAVSLGVAHKRMGASPDTTVSIPACAAATNSIAYVIEAWRGVDWSVPFAAVTPTTASGTNTGLANPPSVSTPAAPSDCVVLGCFGGAVASASVFTNSGATPYDSTANLFKSGVQNTSTNRAVAGMGAKTGLAASTAFDAAITGSTTTNTGSWAALSLVLRARRVAGASPSLDTFLSAAAAKAVVEGTGGGTLNAFTSSATGTISNPSTHATASPALGTFTSSAAAKVRVKAAAAPALNAFISAAAAKALVEGLGSGTLNAFSSTSVAKARVKATAAPALGPFTATAAARVPVEANGAIALGNFTAGASARVLTRLDGSPSMGPFISQAAATALVEGIGAGELNPFGLAGVLSLPIHADAQVELEPFGIDASASVRLRAAVGVELDAFSVAARIGSALAPVELSGSPTLGLFTSGALSPCPVSRWTTARRDSRAIVGRRPSRMIAPNLQPRGIGR